jgi:hypothetical protein
MLRRQQTARVDGHDDRRTEVLGETLNLGCGI